MMYNEMANYPPTTPPNYPTIIGCCRPHVPHRLGGEGGAWWVREGGVPPAGLAGARGRWRHCRSHEGEREGQTRNGGRGEEWRRPKLRESHLNGERVGAGGLGNAPR